VYGPLKKYAGTIDVPLSRFGREDTRQASKVLSDSDFDVIITSTLRRSKETARILLGKNRRMLENPLCNERNYGILEGVKCSEVKKVRPRVLFIKVGNDKHSVNPLGVSLLRM